MHTAVPDEQECTKKGMTKMQNPFTYTFGVKPREYIRNEQSEVILQNFSYDDPVEKAYMITGIRGSGKTVMLTEVSNQIGSRQDWIVIDLNPSRDLLQSLGARLYELPFMKRFFTEAKIDLSLFGPGVSIEKGNEIFDIESAIEKMLRAVQKEKKKVLITIDEAGTNKSMQVFCLTFQRLIRENLPVYMILTGLYQNIHHIKNMEGCTFLQRAPFIILQSLDLSAITVCYKRVFGITKEEAVRLSRLTNGYAFAFQVLGKLYFDKADTTSIEDIILEYESELIIYSYNKIWSELSGKDRLVVKGMVKCGAEGTNPVNRQVLMNETGFSSSMMNRYQSRLREKGILGVSSGVERGYYLTLPRFGNFVKDYHMDE